MIPEKVMICGIPHKVLLCEDNFTTDSHFGQISYTQCEIRINKDMPEELQHQTLVHEMLHGIFVMIGRNDETMDEELVQSLANAIHQSFQIRGETK